ncbi:MAG: hypothetical protein CSA76_01515 [Spirochaetales bacterium]|nr:MAG: hypothetical protein CSA76_01515 [Spirochaetales bacterium]
MLCLLILTVSAAGMLWAEDAEPDNGSFTPQMRTNDRSKGDQTFNISAGIFIPLPVMLLNDWPASGYNAGVTSSKLAVGGVGSLAYNFHITGNIKAGLQLAGSFSKDINKNFMYSIPILIKGAYEFHPHGRISVPLSLGLGINMTSYKDNFLVDMILRPGAGVYYDWSYEWSFGLDISYWFVPQLSPKSKEQWSIGNFMDITLGAEYHF